MQIVCDSVIFRKVKKGKSKAGNDYQFLELMDATGGDLSFSVKPDADLSEVAKMGQFPHSAIFTVVPEIRGFNLVLNLLDWKFKRL